MICFELVRMDKNKTNFTIINSQIQIFRIMFQTVQKTITQIKRKYNKWTHSQKQNYTEQNNPLNQCMNEPSIQEVIQSILIILKQKQNLITQLYNIQGDESLIKPFGYIFKNGGKKIRLVLAILINGLFNRQLKDGVIQIGGFIEMLHTASLIIDDIQDQSQSRRNNPCAHLVFGISNSMNSANLMYFLPFKKILQSNYTQIQKQKIIQIYAKQMITCHLGQAEDIYTHKINRIEDLPTLFDYIRMTSAKTSGLFTMLIQMISVILNIDNKNTLILSKIMTFVGISFQITDDILNITQNMGKNIKAQDFHQRKFTIIVHHLRKNQQFMKLYFIDKKDDQTIQKMISIVKKQGTIKYCQDIAYGYAQKAMRLIQKIDCPYSKSSFKAVVKYVVQRQK